MFSRRGLAAPVRCPTGRGRDEIDCKRGSASGPRRVERTIGGMGSLWNFAGYYLSLLQSTAQTHQAAAPPARAPGLLRQLISAKVHLIWRTIHAI